MREGGVRPLPITEEMTDAQASCEHCQNLKEILECDRTINVQQ